MSDPPATPLRRKNAKVGHFQQNAFSPLMKQNKKQKILVQLLFNSDVKKGGLQITVHIPSLIKRLSCPFKNLQSRFDSSLLCCGLYSAIAPKWQLPKSWQSFLEDMKLIYTTKIKEPVWGGGVCPVMRSSYALWYGTETWHGVGRLGMEL